MEKLSHAKLEQALENHQSALLAYAFSIVKDENTAKDIVQDTFIRLSQQPPDKVELGLKTWLFTVCRNRAFDELRKRKKWVELDGENGPTHADPRPAPDKQLALAEDYREVLEAIDQLPEKQREVLRLKFQQSMSYKEISALTGLKTGNVGFILHTAVKTLRAQFPNILESPRKAN